jgi:type IV pilus assembly protein PilF
MRPAPERERAGRRSRVKTLDISAYWRIILGRSRKFSVIALKHLLIPLTAVLLSGLLSACQTADVQPATGGTPQTTNRVAELQTQLGIGYLREGKLEPAWTRLQRALDADPNYSTAHNAMALVQERLNDPEKAEEHYLLAVSHNPADSAAQNNYGRFLCTQKRFEEGERRFLQAAKNPLYGRPQIAYTNAGLCMKQAKKLDKADRYLRSALEIDPRIPPALIAMSDISFTQERYLPARGYLQRYLALSKHTARSLWLGVQIERQLGDKDTVSSYALMLKSNYPDSRETRLLLESGEL